MFRGMFRGMRGVPPVARGQWPSPWWKPWLGSWLMVALLSACSPSVGSEAWCDAMEDKPKGDWSSNEAADYAQNCVFRKDDD